MAKIIALEIFPEASDGSRKIERIEAGPYPGYNDLFSILMRGEGRTTEELLYHHKTGERVIYHG